jgi:hypothetical protein
MASSPALSRRATALVSYSVMPGLVPGIHAAPRTQNDVDGRDKPGHDDPATDERKTPIAIRDRSPPQLGGQIIAAAA